jgi:hypothetical protein
MQVGIPTYHNSRSRLRMQRKGALKCAISQFEMRDGIAFTPVLRLLAQTWDFDAQIRATPAPPIPRRSPVRQSPLASRSRSARVFRTGPALAGLCRPSCQQRQCTLEHPAAIIAPTPAVTPSPQTYLLFRRPHRLVRRLFQTGRLHSVSFRFIPLRLRTIRDDYSRELSAASSGRSRHAMFKKLIARLVPETTPAPGSCGLLPRRRGGRLANVAAIANAAITAMASATRESGDSSRGDEVTTEPRALNLP